MRKPLAALLLALFAVAPAAAQLPNIQDKAVWGRIGSPAADGGSGPTQAIPLATLSALLFGGLPLAINGCSLGTADLCVPTQILIGPIPAVGASLLIDATIVDSGSHADVAAVQLSPNFPSTITNDAAGIFIAPTFNSTFSPGAFGYGVRSEKPNVVTGKLVDTYIGLEVDDFSGSNCVRVTHCVPIQTFGGTSQFLGNGVLANFGSGTLSTGSYITVTGGGAGSGNGSGAGLELIGGATGLAFIANHSATPLAGAYNANLTIYSVANDVEIAPGGVVTGTFKTDGSFCQGCATAFGAGAIRATGGLGYATGASVGATVTQITSRTTGVTLNNLSGKITLFGAAGSGVAACFTVTNSTVAITDTISVSQVAGTDGYFTASKVAAGSFVLCQFDGTGTTNESPSFQFNVVKGSIN